MAALKVVRERGSESLSLREVAREAGVTHAAPYHHFKDRADLLAAVATAGFVGIRDAMFAAGTENLDPVGKFRARGIAYVDFALSNPALFRVMFGAEASAKSEYPGLAKAFQEAFEMMLEVIEEAQAAGAIWLGPKENFAVAAWSVVHGLSTLLMNGQMENTALHGKSTRELAEIVTGVLFLGMVRRDQ